jgi:hypothetical protein
MVFEGVRALAAPLLPEVEGPSMTCSRLALGALALALLFPLISCGLVRDAGEPVQTQGEAEEVTAEEAEDAEQSPEPEDGAEPEPGSAEDALPYLEAVAANTAEQAKEGLAYAQEGSPAHGYLQYRADNAQAILDMGETSEGWDIDLREEDAQLCAPGGCVTFGAFMFEGGLLSDFEVNGNVVSDNLHPGGNSVEQQGTTVTVGSSYFSADSNHLAVILYLEADSGTHFEVTGANYRAPGGSGFMEQPDGSAGNMVVGSGESRVLLFLYEGAAAGGEMEVFLDCLQGCESALTTEIALS